MRKRLENHLNHYSVKKKLLVVFVVCVLLPLFITDGVVISLFFQTENKKIEYEMQNIANAVRTDFEFSFGEAERITAAIYTNRFLNNFLSREFESNLDFITQSHTFVKNCMYENSYGFSDSLVVLYADNPSFINGGHFRKMNEAKEAQWYHDFEETGRDVQLQFYYDNQERKVSIIRKLNYYHDDDMEKMVKLDLNYNVLLRNLTNKKYSMPVYVCDDDRILFSNVGHSQYTRNFEPYFPQKNTGYTMTMNLMGNPIRIIVLKEDTMVLQSIKNALPWIMLIVLFNIVIPLFVMNIINRSFTSRLTQLSRVFEQTEIDNLTEIKNIKGQDEIAMLMSNYNRMVQRFNELIRAIYMNRLERQDLDIARQRAELLALRSQINPHFLANVLESIRMHCVIRREDETAHMVEQLALLERQNANWSKDFIPIKEEIQLIRLYLDLQKYRFGDRLSYDLEIDEDCEMFLIPKLTIVTFAENACVHGIEGKLAPCWIYVRVYKRNDFLIIEIEDTGAGIKPQQRDALIEKIKKASIDSLRKDEHIGIMNACLRLKLAVSTEIDIELESEEGVGTFFMIKIPLKVLKKYTGGR